MIISGTEETTQETSWLTQLVSAIPAGITAYQQIRLQEKQMKLLESGKAPLDPKYFAPSANVNVGVNNAASTWLLVGGAALLLYMLMRKR